MSVRYTLVVAKGDRRSEGPDDAVVECTIPVEVATEDAFDATVEFMRGRLKVSGPSGVLFDELSSGRADAAVRRLVSAAGSHEVS